ncbi:MAG: hypothetical protein WBA57_15390 [Elainellaceae cyanobacterium]
MSSPSESNIATQGRRIQRENVVDESGLPESDRFYISPLIRLTLHSLYGSLMLPLPVLANVTQAPVPPWLLGIGIGVGWVLLYAALSEQVTVDQQGIAVCYPSWVPLVWRRGWTLPWSEIKALKPRSTGQGGIVYYFLSQQEHAFLLPMRVAGFARLVRYVEAKTGIDTQDVRPLAQPWMYFILLAFTGLLWLTDAWTLWTAASLS